MEQTKQEILCIDDDNDTCELVEFMFKQKGYKVLACLNAAEGVQSARNKEFGAIILDNRFQGSDGADICEQIRSFDKSTPIIFFTGEARTVEKERAFAAGANEYLLKPNDLDKLTETIINFIEIKK
jgi:two-component system chemotaxis response regulator CheY